MIVNEIKAQPVHLHACEECGLVAEVTTPEFGYKVQCGRCHHTLMAIPKHLYHSVLAYGISVLIMLALSCSFPFMSFSVQGLSQQVTLLDAAVSMHHYQNTLLTIILILCVLILPCVYAVTQMYLHIHIYRKNKGKVVPLTRLKWITRYIFKIKPWLMADVFLVGILVAMVKIVSLADVWLGPSFWAFFTYSMLVVKFSSLINVTWIWEQLQPNVLIDNVKVGDSHLTKSHIACHSCHQINPYNDGGVCLRCHTPLHAYDQKSNLQKAWALLIAASILYLPANLYPMMYTTSVGQTEESTILSGVALLWHLKSYPVAMVIFFASIIIPLSKIIILIYLYHHSGKANQRNVLTARKNITLYRITEFIGRWSMIDIFVVALLAALVQLHQLMSIEPGPAALSFAAVVILTMLSALTFDSRCLWQHTSFNKSEKLT